MNGDFQRGVHPVRIKKNAKLRKVRMKSKMIKDVVGWPGGRAEMEGAQ
jgi:hypothetical protein